MKRPLAASCAFVLARDYEKDDLEETPIEMGRVGWLERF